MDFSEKLRTLRKQHGLSQEELAHRLGVSRQAVSKWETGQGFPDTDKLLVLSNMFAVSLDYLLKNGDVGETVHTDSRYFVSPDLAGEYFAFKKKRGYQIAIGVALLVFSLSFTLFFSGPLGVVLFLLVAALGLAVLVMLAFQPDRMRFFELERRPLAFDPGFLQRFQDDFAAEQRRCGLKIALAVFLIILSFTLAFIIDEGGYGDQYLGVMPMVWALAVGLIIAAGTTIGAGHVILNNPDHVEEVEEEERQSWIYAATMPLSGVLYLALGFIWNAWHPGWLVFPLTAILSYAYSAWQSARRS